ncbi:MULTISPECIES: 2-oxoglutarate dehydrogenase complex dihydrolipoyllysine-residue succinyltransferase [Mesoflavibacter]|uniref:Dihydrolipoyllysine-residue succinyltransferase component of 2-oxoglutarate dehydrogenase complex n=1 Tax=Mesoflavibacter profundi TaxID=2708110 RepID=A0ABT4S2D2_9FLAO|nr:MULTISPECIES: 2-oxoglutarate dehydrogenase complex dihydrolipoyllysine-residue succinyltransferase [Mesoflavibacter]MDA0178230.1 2-oxoglutarate dehydrogenase complex dihydrolipoyllysine-residue succinyltransferase [Mesoflavibacter profundi]QIJ89192.1 Dihydrolipoamide succinyltransferase component (E2) of 2-oxoglutarate dehydrogenase complex [Mesoflavibacter sp. HG96]QIJ91920.1 Dihydrolipoamide succinyltransferase component (E2) of 2-oxoglutarate dehydrogenase complex [Mesoflavibacter sp. HG37
MILEMKVPSPGESITEVEIAEWLVQDGDYVEKDQAIAEVDSDKATLELPAEASGVITLKAEEGDAVAVGQVVCLIDTSAEAPASSTYEGGDEGGNNDAEKDVAKAQKATPNTEEKAPNPAKDTYASGVASPAAKKILAEKGIEASAVSGTGKDGRVTKDDAVKAVPSMGTPTGGNRGQSRSKMSMLRRKVAERLVEAKNTTAMLTTFNEVNMTPIFELRKQYKEEFKSKHGVGLGFMSFFTLAVVRALKEYPAVNSMIDGKEMISYDFVDVSIAVSGPKGLMVPVIRNAENLTFRGVESEVKRLALRARDGQITVDEMTGGTFTISNGGVFGSMLSTPIINPPQSGILGMHNIIERPIAVDGKVEIHPMMYVALSYDHRIIDGRESVGFLVAVKEALENPKELLMNNDIKKALEL